MFPAQTSLIPITVAIAQFIESNGIASLLGWYPYWYLGVPARFLSGPVVPAFLFFIHKLLPNVSFFSIAIYLIILSFLFGATGWGILAKKISGSKGIGFTVGLLATILPWRYLSSLALSETSFVISRNFLPFVFIAFWNFLASRSKKSASLALLTISFLLLINTGILAILMVGIASLVLALSFKKGKIKKVSEYIKPLLLILGVGLAIVTFWYTPSYWLVTLTNPSIGGASGFKVILRIFDLLRAAVPLVLAIFAVYFSGKIKSRLAVFTLIWTLTFAFLTFFRFIGDPDFWQDWTSWVYELEIGLAFLAVKFARSKKFGPAGFTLLLPIFLTFYVYGLLGRPDLVRRFPPKGVVGLEKLTEIARGKRVFLSGSTVFWAGSTGSPLFQVRGGVDKVAAHPFWDHAAYQLREGESPELARAWLEALGVSFILVHTPASAEAYHDFRNIDKWEEVGRVAWQEGGDVIVEVPTATQAWVVDLDELKRTSSPKSGIDLASLNAYLSAKKRPVEVTWQGSDQVLIDAKGLKKNEGVVLAVSFNSKWRTKEGVSLNKDPLGNILVTPTQSVPETLTLYYK